MDSLRRGQRGKNAYFADSTGTRIERNEVLAWVAYAEGRQEDALAAMRDAADLQDKVGQGEVDIPAREMLGDMLRKFGHPIARSPNVPSRSNSVPTASMDSMALARAAEAAGDTQKAAMFYALLLKSTANGEDSRRPELTHARSFVAPAATRPIGAYLLLLECGPFPERPSGAARVSVPSWGGKPTARFLNLRSSAPGVLNSRQTPAASKQGGAATDSASVPSRSTSPKTRSSAHAQRKRPAR